MTSLTIDTSPEQRMLELGLSLPNVPTPIANFVPFRRDRDRSFPCRPDLRMERRGKVPRQARRRPRAGRRPGGGAHLRAQSAGRATRSLRRITQPRHRLPAGRRLRQLRARLSASSAGHQWCVEHDSCAVRRPWPSCPNSDRRSKPSARRRGRSRRHLCRRLKQHGRYSSISQRNPAASLGQPWSG